jgi:hypothetical protein
MLQDLETFKKVIAKRYNNKARTDKVKAATAPAPKANEPRMPKKQRGKGSEGGTRKKGWSDKYCKWWKAVDGSFTTHDTNECCRFSKDGSPKDKPTKSFGSGKKTWKKMGTRDSDQVANLTERLSKLKKKQKKARKLKKHARDLSDSDSDSDKDSVR